MTCPFAVLGEDISRLITSPFSKDYRRLCQDWEEILGLTRSGVLGGWATFQREGKT